MSELEVERQEASGDEVAAEERQVPVSEAIRYRKRAQAAEKETADLQRQVAEGREEIGRLGTELEALRMERDLAGRLAAAGATDVEAAVLLAKSRLAADASLDAAGVVERLRQEKGYLFADTVRDEMPRTAGARDRASAGRGALERTARRAAASGSRTDVHEYLRARRQKRG